MWCTASSLKYNSIFILLYFGGLRFSWKEAMTTVVSIEEDYMTAALSRTLSAGREAGYT
jgi:hypothetical protein